LNVSPKTVVSQKHGDSRIELIASHVRKSKGVQAHHVRRIHRKECKLIMSVVSSKRALLRSTLRAKKCSSLCPKYPQNVFCFVQPCVVNPCGPNEICCDDYSKGCDRHCFGCPTYPVKVNCFAQPCAVNPCAANEICCDDYSVGCNLKKPSSPSCPSYPVNVNCFVQPCAVNPCGPNEICCDDYSKGCDRHCFGCPAYPVKVNCFAQPCAVNPCAANEICCDDYSVGCNRHCFPK
ncbi:hypothetical protein Bhyg_16152, partial [Pseudolycoriella hygida]